MIGQVETQERFNKLLEDNKFPHFVILTGIRGSGKKLMAETLAKRCTDTFMILNDISIASIRELISDAYSKHSLCYIIPDADKMSLAAKNAMLKLTEEPPNDTYVIMTLEDINNTLPTIKSRASVFELDPYTKDDIYDFALQVANTKGQDKIDESNIVSKVCNTPGEARLMLSQHPIDFYNYVEKVIDNISVAAGANAFKIPDKVALKDAEDGYDLQLFWKIFMLICDRRALENNKSFSYAMGIVITSKYLSKLRIKGINKQMLMDTWILDIREEWM